MCPKFPIVMIYVFLAFSGSETSILIVFGISFSVLASFVHTHVCNSARLYCRFSMGGFMLY